jgi:3,4-dihydroxy-2-butanone 4-phosphate synthase
MTPSPIDQPARRVAAAVADLRAGRAVVIAEGSHGVGYLAFAGSEASTDTVSWVVRHGSGFLCAVMLPDRARALDLPLLSPADAGSTRPRYAVSVDAASGSTTGISARDRARTIALLANPGAQAGDFTRPGHVVVECVTAGGVLTRPRASEGLADLLGMANLPLVGGLCALVSERQPTALASGQELHEFCKSHGTTLIDVNDLVAFRELTEPPVVHVGTASYGPADDDVTMHRYTGRSGATYLAAHFGAEPSASALILLIDTGPEPARIANGDDLRPSDIVLAGRAGRPVDGAMSERGQVNIVDPEQLPLVFDVLELRSVLAALRPCVPADVT